MSAVREITATAARMALMGLMVETYDTPAERKTFVMGMYECGAISAQAAELLIEAYMLESA